MSTPDSVAAVLDRVREKGATGDLIYSFDGPLADRYVSGEDPSHPLYVGAWGEGSKPSMATNATITNTAAIAP